MIFSYIFMAANNFFCPIYERNYTNHVFLHTAYISFINRTKKIFATMKMYKNIILYFHESKNLST